MFNFELHYIYFAALVTIFHFLKMQHTVKDYTSGSGPFRLLIFNSTNVTWFHLKKIL